MISLLLNFLSFVPFIGSAISKENLSFQEVNENQKSMDQEERKLGYGVTFGCDIRPNRMQSWILRTNLRWFPNLNMDLGANENVSLDNLDFNFIQLIVYPNRMVKPKSKG